MLDNILSHIYLQVFNLTHNCFNIVNKGALLLNEDMFIDIMPVAWELLLENDPELVASAANVIILAAIKIPTLAQQLIFRELQHEDVNQRMSALLRCVVTMTNARPLPYRNVQIP